MTDTSAYALPDGPVAIQFSAGRSSAYMLHEILRAYDGQLPPDCHVLFQNTGRERQESIDFLLECGERWNVPITLLEYDTEEKFRSVGPGTNQPISMAGEPFEALIRKRGFTPNSVARFCTAEMKVRPARDYLTWLGYERWTAIIGFRADEKRRAVRTVKNCERERWSVDFPMIRAGVTKRHVAAFWKRQPFDLRLPMTPQGKTPEGNCDGCMLKSMANRAWLARHHPERAKWWADMEALAGGTFDKRTSWAELIASVEKQPDWVFDEGAYRDLYCDSSLGGCHD